MSDCEYCGRTFATVSSLNYHKKHTKYCLRIQEEKGHQIPTKITCEHCQHQFTAYSIYTAHLVTCRKKNEGDCKFKDSLIHKLTIELESSKKLIEELKAQLETANNKIYELAKQPKTTHNTNTTINLKPLDLDKLKALEISIDTLRRGADGFVELLHEPLSHSMVCTDVARAIFRVKNEEGSVIKDPHLRTHTPLIFGTLYPSIKTTLTQQTLQSSDEDLDQYLSETSQLVDLDTDITKTIKKVSNKFQDAFVNGIKEKLPR